MEKARKSNITNKGGNGKVMIKKNRNYDDYKRFFTNCFADDGKELWNDKVATN
jgi:hypothetical protein